MSYSSILQSTMDAAGCPQEAAMQGSQVQDSLAQGDTQKIFFVLHRSFCHLQLFRSNLQDRYRHHCRDGRAPDAIGKTVHKLMCSR